MVKHSCEHMEDFKGIYEHIGATKADLANIKKDVEEVKSDLKYVRERIDSAVMPLIYKIGTAVAVVASTAAIIWK